MSETETVAVKLSAGEFIQYLVSSPCTNLSFSLADVVTNEMILSDRVPATILEPLTFTRLWPVVGDRPQQESSLAFSVRFAEARNHCTFQVQHRRPDGSWRPLIDVEFEASEAGDTYRYQFSVLTD